MQFNWHPDEPPPPIEPHSKAKLQVLRSYLRAYFDRLGTVYARDEFKLDLVDGFAGGGTFLDGSESISGTPLIMLEEAREAKKRLTHGRSKPIRFDFKFYFVDANAAHTDHLRRAMAERGYNANDEAVVIRTGKFEDNVRAIVREIKNASRELSALCFCSINSAIRKWLFGMSPASSANYRELRSYLRSPPTRSSTSYATDRSSSRLSHR